MDRKQGRRYIGAYLWKRERHGIVFTFLFALYIGAVLSLSINDLVGGDEAPQYYHGMIDWIYVTMLPVFGTVMNKSAFGMWRDDFYSKRLAHWRTMPIPIASIVQIRYLQVGCSLPIIGACFFFLQYVVSPHLREAVTPLQWGACGLAWLVYAFAVNSLFVWLELGFDGKRYVIGYLGYMALMAAVCALLAWQKVYVFESVLKLVNDGYVWQLFLVTTVAASIATGAGYRTTVKRIRSRSLAL
ncbi:hypothetical protein D7Z26_14095 [Cohnella endophytica]|uniref:ABC transporter permease n=1 Tax=Cohnella endophytica TaxID=2419778 RepID=A0A494XZB1_9BACL|nr:hypothetical protein [Cohnella endophytica]RKP52883.1 hypothetical protein D7Z26_14095 [Cohnella endophytica]